MQLIYIHGAPAVGKLTVAKHLAHLTGARLFDNHIAIDLAKTVLDFERDGFWELVVRTRTLVLEVAAQQSVPLVVMTSCYSDPKDREMLEGYEKTLDRLDAKILPVYLHCTEEQLHCRVQSSARREGGKISSIAKLDTFLAQTTCTPIPRENCLKIYTEQLPAEDTAKCIINHFNLHIRQNEQSQSSIEIDPLA